MTTTVTISYDAWKAREVQKDELLTDAETKEVNDLFGVCNAIHQLSGKQYHRVPRDDPHKLMFGLKFWLDAEKEQEPQITDLIKDAVEARGFQFEVTELSEWGS